MVRAPQIPSPPAGQDHSLAIDKNDAIYAADRNNRRIRVYDTEFNFKRSIRSEFRVTPAQDTPYLFSADSTTGQIYKIDLGSGKTLAWAQTSLATGRMMPACWSTKFPALQRTRFIWVRRFFGTFNASRSNSIGRRAVRNFAPLPHLG